MKRHMEGSSSHLEILSGCKVQCPMPICGLFRRHDFVLSANDMGAEAYKAISVMVKGVSQTGIRRPRRTEGQGISLLLARLLAGKEVLALSMGLPMLREVPFHLCLHSVAQHFSLRVMIQLQAFHILRRRVQIDIVGKVIQIGFHLHLPCFVAPADAGIQLIRFLWVELRVAPFVAEDVVIHTVSSQFLGNRHTKALTHIRLHHPLAYVVVYTR